MSFDTLGDLNYLAVLVGAVAYWMIGALWYSPPLFGKRYMALAGPRAEGGASPGVLYALTLVLEFVISLGLAFLARSSGATDLGDGVVLGLVVGVAIAGMVTVVGSLFDRRPPALVAMNVAYNLVGILVASIIVTVWD